MVVLVQVRGVAGWALGEVAAGRCLKVPVCAPVHFERAADAAPVLLAREVRLELNPAVNHPVVGRVLLCNLGPATELARPPARPNVRARTAHALAAELALVVLLDHGGSFWDEGSQRCGEIPGSDSASDRY